MLYGISHLWFLMVIFECYIISRLVDKILTFKKTILIRLAIVTIIFIPILSYRFNFLNILGLPLLIHYFPYYLLGMLFSKINFDIFLNYRKVIALGSICLLICFVFQQLYFKIIQLSILFGLLLVCLIFVQLRITHIKTRPRFIASLDTCSMGIYIIHHLLIQEMNGNFYLHNIAINYYIAYPLVQFFIVLFVSWGIVAMCKKNTYAKYFLG